MCSVSAERYYYNMTCLQKIKGIIWKEYYYSD